ncbi:glycosyltransferase [Microlunatus antarcticus]|uniref:Poly(Glycerol-phosphate) alpha-glucosyltransferase n=1 Tax=Microlunatus antarcticus TaxID=53388 RepID=A0A7W5JX00_9ACTN|nr:glycosyltransferase [Microlunatus antarcticus]MBB3327854.1 poly(glycerol-phosphate) alpha-glucosyltransferase [Microlunatus antarcticus]
MSSDPVALRTEETPCLLFPELFAQGGGLQRSVQERASLYAERWDRVLLLTTGFTPNWHSVPVALKERGSLHPRVKVRNFFAHSDWMQQLGVPPLEAYAVVGEDEVTTRAQKLKGREPFRLADFRPGERFPFRFRYFDTEGRPFLTTFVSGDTKQESRGVDAAGNRVDWYRVLADWVDAKIADVPHPVLFSLKRGSNDPVLLKSQKAYRKIASLHNCHYKDPDDRSSGIRPSFRTLFDHADQVDQIVCQTQQQLTELREDVPGMPLSAIRYPGRDVGQEPVEKDPSLVLLVSQLIERKRIDHAIRAFPLVLESVPEARLEIYGQGPLKDKLQGLIDELGVGESVTLMGYSLTVGEAQARAACVLLTSTFEGSPRVVTESMSRGTAAVSYDIRYGPRDLITHGVDGLLVERHEPAALAAAIVSLVSDPDRVVEMGRRAGEIVERHPASAFEEAWCELLMAPPRKPDVLSRARNLKKWVRSSRPVRRLRRISTALPAPYGTSREKRSRTRTSA